MCGPRLFKLRFSLSYHALTQRHRQDPRNPSSRGFATRQSLDRAPNQRKLDASARKHPRIPYRWLPRVPSGRKSRFCAFHTPSSRRHASVSPVNRAPSCERVTRPSALGLQDLEAIPVAQPIWATIVFARPRADSHHCREPNHTSFSPTCWLFATAESLCPACVRVRLELAFWPQYL